MQMLIFDEITVSATIHLSFAHRYEISPTFYTPKKLIFFLGCFAFGQNHLWSVLIWRSMQEK